MRGTSWDHSNEGVIMGLSELASSSNALPVLPPLVAGEQTCGDLESSFRQLSGQTWIKSKKYTWDIEINIKSVGGHQHA